MKGMVTVILWLLFALVCTKVGSDCVTKTIAPPHAAALFAMTAWDDQCQEDAVLPLERDRANADMEVNGSQGVVYRFHVSLQRMYRFSSVEVALFIRNLLHENAIHMTGLANTYTGAYHTSRSLGRENACQHYVFGLRHILI